MPEAPVLGIDIGGTKVAVGVVDLATQVTLSTLVTPTPAAQGGGAVFATVIDLCHQLPEIARIKAIGVCFGGPVNRNRVMHSNHVVGWDNFSLAERLQRDIAPVPVRIVNDANAIAWLEWTQRVKVGKLASLFYMTVSTGIGGGLVLDHRIIEGRNGMASEIGHLILEPDGPVCTCGNRGCLEALAAGPAISNVYAERTGQVLTAREIVDCSRQGDAAAIAVVEESGRYVGQALAALNVMLDVDLVVIGGGVSRSGSVWWNAVQTRFIADTLPWSQPPALSLSTYGELEGVLAGAVATQNAL